MSARYETVEYAAVDGVATITMNRPEGLNAWTHQVAEDLVAALGAAQADAEVRAVITTGAGRAFSSGADLKGSISPGPDGKIDLHAHLMETFNPVIQTVRDIPKPVIAAVNGPAAGIGASFALAADIIVAAQSAYFLLAFANVGLSIDGGASTLLAGRIGFTRAAEMALLADKVSAPDALGWGLVNRVVADTEVLRTAEALAGRFAAGPPGAYAAIKQLLNASCFGDLTAALEREAVLQGERGVSADFAEGVMAFSEKRPPRFTGA